MARRERATIAGEMLEALSRAGGVSDKRLTHVAMRVNLPYDRFKEYLEDMQRRGLVQKDDPFMLTTEGRKLLDTYKAWREGLRLFGMADPE